MGETEKTSKAPKENWFAGLKAEFGKIIWPAKESLAKQTTAVVIVSVVVGLIIAVLDFFIQHGVDILVKLQEAEVIYGRGTLVCGAYLFRI